MRRTHIEIRAAATHNLRDVDVDIPLGQITTVTGVSGSGKSSLAIDTLFAEAQRRFVESLSAYARQFLDRIERPSFERIDFIPPAIAIGQGSRPRTSRATVGSMSQIADLLQLYWGAESVPTCPNGHGPIAHRAPQAVRDEVVEGHLGERIIVVAPVAVQHRKMLLQDGYTRGVDDNDKVTELSEINDNVLPVLVDRFKVKDDHRVAEAMTAAFRLADGRAELRFVDRDDRRLLRETLSCGKCSAELPPREVRMFSPSSAVGACPTCEGFGRTAMVDPEKVIPDPAKSLLQDAVAPWATPTRANNKRKYHELARERGLRLGVPWQDLTDGERELVWNGDREVGFKGVRGFFDRLQRKRYKMSARILIARYRGYERCSDCHGSGLRPESLHYRIDGWSIADAQGETVTALRAWAESRHVHPEVEPLRERLVRRLRILEDVGLGYLTLDREGRTLSAGEARRVHLSSALGAGVTGTLYVLDEPSIGLHPKDTARLASLLHELAEAGNTVVVVEHDTDLIESSDYVLELGPAAGRHGGHLIFSGDPGELRSADTPTGRTLRFEAEDVTLEPSTEPFESASIQIRGARARTLSDLDLDIPKGAMTCITGVSGSGKSTLLHQVLARNLRRISTGARPDPGTVEAIRGTNDLGRTHVVDTSPLARSVRSIPATYLDAWTPIRAAIAASPEAKAAGLTSRDLSFNSKGGRCETCKGLGTVTVDMQFLADVSIPCEECDGRRFKKHVLDVRWRGLNIYDVLGLTVDEAHELFAGHAKVRKRLEPLRMVGLGYVTLGQATSTLSGGEAQRLKLAAHLAAKTDHRPILLLDEPTTGLHATDVHQLIRSFDALLERGATIVIVEHNLEVIRHAHHVIDLGPSGGADGGRLMAAGSIYDLMGEESSDTGRALQAYLSRESSS